MSLNVNVLLNILLGLIAFIVGLFGAWSLKASLSVSADLYIKRQRQLKKLPKWLKEYTTRYRAYPTDRTFRRNRSVRIASRLNGLCLQADGHNRAIMKPCRAENRQLFTVTNRGQLVNRQTGRCLSIRGRGNGNHLRQERCRNYGRMRFQSLRNGTIRNRGSRKCLTLPTTSENARIEQWNCSRRSTDRENGQLWALRHQ